MSESKPDLRERIARALHADTVELTGHGRPYAELPQASRQHYERKAERVLSAVREHLQPIAHDGHEQVRQRQVDAIFQDA